MASGEHGLNGEGWRQLSEGDGNVLYLIGVLANLVRQESKITELHFTMCEVYPQPIQMF